MSESQMVSYEVDGVVAVITVNNPPVNALTPAMREGIIDGVTRANADVDIAAIVLMGAGQNFIAGADIRQFGKARTVTTSMSAAALDASVKPIVAAIHGYALGGGLEHALACHYRIALPTAKLGLPEVAIGLIPGGGGTQRLPRLVGAVVATDLIISSRHVQATEALQIGLLTEIVSGTEHSDLREAAVRYAKSVAHVQPQRVRDSVPEPMDAQTMEVLQAARRAAVKKSKHNKAPLYALDCIEAAFSLSFDDALAVEKQLFSELEGSDVAKALRYAFFAEREAAKVPDAPSDFKPVGVKSAAVIGAGTMGAGIAICFADAGIPVKLLEASAEALERGLQRIRDIYAVKVKRGRMTAQEMEACLRFVQPIADFEEIGDCDVVVEAVFERIDLKKDVFTKLDAVMKPGALLLTNSSAIDINVMADMTSRPQHVAGAHFFAPANAMKLCEIVKGDQTSIETVVRAMKMGRDLKKVCAVSGTCDGFAANRSRAPLVTEMMLLLEEGARPEQIDRVMVEFGYPMGPFAVSDLSGLDVSYDTRQRRAAADPQYRKLHVPDRMVEMGRKGQKNGAGWYRYEEGDRTPHHDEDVMQIIATVAKELGTVQRTFTDSEILKRLLFASINEACKILDEGKAYRASDIDVMWLYGFGFPRHRGGLLYWADTVGAKDIYVQVQEWHEQYGRRWAPSPLLAKAANEGLTLRELKSLI